MKTALPYTDDFLDCHDLEKLEEFGRSLVKVAGLIRIHPETTFRNIEVRNVFVWRF